MDGSTVLPDIIYHLPLHSLSCADLRQRFTPMASTITFPSTEPRSQFNKSDTSLVPRHTAAIEVCNLVYGQVDPVSWDTLGRFYEADAGSLSFPYGFIAFQLFI